MKHLLVFIPTYNEKENIPLLYKRLREQGNFDLLFLDDNSPDGTGKIIDAIAKDDAQVAVIHRLGKQGIGSAHKVGIRYAYDQGYSRLITMDADFTHDPALIPKILELSENYDLVIPSRYLEDGSLDDWNLFRKGLTKLGHLLTYSLLGLKNDATGAYRLYRLDKIPKRFLDLVESNGYSFFFESLYVLNQNRFKMVEIPIKLPKRTYGSSKMSYKEILKSLKQLGVLSVRSLVAPGSSQI